MAAKHVLVVDDQPAVLELAQVLLDRLGYRVETASDGSEALRKFETTAFDLVITDLYMPGMTGSELAQELRKLKPSLPVILITGSRGGAHLPGFAAVLNKPFSAAALGRVVAKALDSDA
jgi:CheY-like chemotaxis protein